MSSEQWSKDIIRPLLTAHYSLKFNFHPVQSPHVFVGQFEIEIFGKFFRLFGRYASNRNQIWFNQKKPGEVTLKKSGSSFYMGNDLRDWLREDPEREWVFSYPSSCRPAD